MDTEQVKEMDISQYADKSKKTLRITVELINNTKEFDKKRAVIVGEGQMRVLPARNDKQGKPIPEKQVLVIPVNFNGEEAEFICNPTNADTLVKKLESTDTRQWIGTVIQFTVTGIGVPYLLVDVVQKPKRDK